MSRISSFSRFDDFACAAGSCWRVLRFAVGDKRCLAGSVFRNRYRFDSARIEVALARPVSRRLGDGGRWRTGRSQYLLFRCGRRRRVENQRRWPDLAAVIQQHVGLVDRRTRCRRIGSERAVCGHRADHVALRRRVRRRRVKSPEAGKTWQSMGLRKRAISAQSWSIRMMRTRCWSARSDIMFGPNPRARCIPQRRRRKTWKHTLSISENTGVVDLAADPENPSIVYAAAWQMRFYPWLRYFQPNVGPGAASTARGRRPELEAPAGGGWPTAPRAHRPGRRRRARACTRSYAEETHPMRRPVSLRRRRRALAARERRRPKIRLFRAHHGRSRDSDPCTR